MEASDSSNSNDHYNNEEDDHLVPLIPMPPIASNPTLLEEDEEEDEYDYPLVLLLSPSPPIAQTTVQEQHGNHQIPEQLVVTTTQNEENDHPTLDLGVPRWPTDCPGKIQPMRLLLQNRITLIYGNVQCDNCGNISKRFYHILHDFRQVAKFVLARPEMVEPWNHGNNARVSTCARCEQEVWCNPVIPENSGDIDWLFLLLGQFIEYCTDSQLQDYCNRNNIQFQVGNAAALRARRIHAAYWTLCHQLDPCGLFKTPYLTT